MWIIVHDGKAYGPFPDRVEALYWVAGSSMALDCYSIHPLLAPRLSLDVPRGTLAVTV